MKYFISFFVLTIWALSGYQCVVAANIYDYSIQVDSAGGFTLSGKLEPSVKYQVTIKVVEKASGTIKYIDQLSSDTSGNFLFTGNIPLYSKTKAYSVFIGGSNVNIPMQYEWIKYDINNVPDNSIRVGVDIYELNSKDLTSANVINSIKSGGNSIFYKLLGGWFDVMNPLAKNSQYFFNSDNEENTDGWSINKWYTENEGIISLN